MWEYEFGLLSRRFCEHRRRVANWKPTNVYCILFSLLCRENRGKKNVYEKRLEIDCECPGRLGTVVHRRVFSTRSARSVTGLCYRTVAGANALFIHFSRLRTGDDGPVNRSRFSDRCCPDPNSRTRRSKFVWHIGKLTENSSFSWVWTMWNSAFNGPRKARERTDKNLIDKTPHFNSVWHTWFHDWLDPGRRRYRLPNVRHLARPRRERGDTGRVTSKDKTLSRRVDDPNS